MLKSVELRKLPAGSLCKITETLETNGDWKKVMSLIPKDLEDKEYQPKYSNQQMKVIEDYAKQTNRNCAEILFDEWGTSGKVRPTLGTLQDIILKAGVYKAADEIALILNEPLPSRPEEGPAAKIDTGVSLFLKPSKAYKKDQTESTAQVKSSGFPSFFKLKNKKPGNSSTQQIKTEITNSAYDSNNGLPNIPDLSKLVKVDNKEKNVDKMPYPRLLKIDTTILENKSLVIFKYKELEEITSGFSNDFIHGPYGPTGKIGSGGFGDVYAGWHHQHGTLAVKKFKNLGSLGIVNNKPDFLARTFNTEVRSLAHLRHDNIVPIVGYCIEVGDSGFPSLCIVCQYVDGGSLEQGLAKKRLTEKQRLDILKGTARGLRYIHNTEVTDTEAEDGEDSIVHYLHGDVKTANILLTRDYQAKLCDLGLAKQFNMTTVTESIVGTRPYISPERHRGTVSQKSDVYSFGIVILEVLTGLQCAVRVRSDIININDYVTMKLKQTNSTDIGELLDPVAKPWNKGQEMYELARKCLETDYILRFSMDQVCDHLIRICEDETAEAVD